MTTIEELGLLKMDFLGLRTLTVIQNAVEMANHSIEMAGGAYPPSEPAVGPVRPAQNPLGPVVSMDRLDYADPNVYRYISSGRTDGIFQLESGGMQGFMKELRPENFEDVIAGISLYRPGPMDFIPQYIEGKNNRGSVRYACPELGADTQAYLRLYRLPGAGHADRPGPRRLYAGQERSGPPRHE